MIKAIIFDCFGVLVTDALQTICDTLPQSKVEQIKGIVTESITGAIDAETASQSIAEILEMSYEAYRNAIRNGEVRNKVLLDYILDLKKSFKTAMLSNIGKGSLEKRFTAAEQKIYFDVVVASGDVGFAKPETAAYELTAGRLGVRLESCIFIDDREDYCAGARAIGMHTILYDSYNQFRSDLADLLGENGEPFEKARHR